VVWWIGGGVVLFALLVLVLSMLSVLGSLRRLVLVLHTLQRRLLDGSARLQPSLDAMRQRAEEMQEPLLAAQERAELIQARRGGNGRVS
jgi:hypothetical protein